MADLKIPKKSISDRFNLQDFKDDFNALNEEISEAKENLTTLENTKGTINGDLSVTGSINLSGTPRVMDYDGYTIIATGAESKHLYLRPNSANSETGQIVLKGDITTIDGNVAMNSNSRFYIGNTEYCQGGINNWGTNDDFVLHLNSGKCFIASDGANRNNSLGHPNSPWQDIWLNGCQKSQTGYTKLPNGLILQWGMIEVKNQNYDMNIWYPVSFPNYCLGVWFEDIMNVYDDKREWVQFGVWNNHNLDNFTFRMQGANNWIYPMYFALGY